MEVEFNKRWLTGGMEVAGVDLVVADAYTSRALRRAPRSWKPCPSCVLVHTTDNIRIIIQLYAGTCLVWHPGNWKPIRPRSFILDWLLWK